VWLILGGGAIFAAWPFVYAVSFSGFYLAMFLVLASLILRPVSFKYRSKHADRVAFALGYGAVRGRFRARAGVWRGGGQCAGGGALPFRQRSAHDL
jgi:hypothetical protein